MFPLVCADIFQLLLLSRVPLFSGGVRGYFLFTTTIASFVLFGWRARSYYYCEFCGISGGVRGFLITTTLTSFVVLRVVCAVIFNYYYYHEFCFVFFGWPARLFLIITTTASFVFRVAHSFIFN